ncbi:hypothetical protein QTO34_000974 [Cnephaeus nilssonii]|uniref:Uncharacterized protein n=1 Tax=Cnephaeus nilssonii TaxID=3371016 RepID=A0AA40LN89_CNENI|nr:hypothetical protein QTO34_000974 [Eptesicus nilssonii]
MCPLAKTALSRLPVRSIQRTMARPVRQKRTPDFRGDVALLRSLRAPFCVAAWTWTQHRVEQNGACPCWQSHPKATERS